MIEANIALSNRCKELVHSVQQAELWVQDNREVVRSEADPLQARLRRSARLLKRCQRAATRKMCVGVFGPSQSGKSYLISALARDAQATLLADFAGATHDFIREINPEGGKESTGLVTRFTLSPHQSPEGYPVRIGLLSEMDIVKIIANTFYSDGEHKELPNTEAITASLDQLARKAASSPLPDVNSDDLEDLHEYVSRRFSSSVRINPLDRAYWPRAIELAPRLLPEDRALLFAHIWDEVEEFTSLYLELCAALKQLDPKGGAKEAFCSLEALLPRERSIIDVATLQGLGGKAAPNSENSLEVVTASGGKASLPRNVVAALTAELTIVMPNKPDDFFDNVDLLDFPGYRSRLKVKQIHQEVAKPNALEGFFLRGKVAYLFERYCDERELTSMLLCIGPGNQEVQDLPGVIDAWVRATHGETAAERKGKDSALFFVLTKFDMEFEEKKGASATAEGRWKTRLHASLLDFFGKQYDWPQNWDGGPFNNLYWLRNPNFKCKAIFEYNEDIETGVRKDQEEYIRSFEEAFAHSPEVAMHFKNPKAAWDSAMTLNDGGITHLRNSLRPMCNPEIKLKQIEALVKHEIKLVHDRLLAYYRSDDREEERKAKTQLAKHLSSFLAKNVQEQRFGKLLSAMQLQDYYYYDLYFQVQSRDLLANSEDGNNPGEAALGARTSANDLLDELFGDEPLAGEPLKNAPPTNPKNTQGKAENKSSPDVPLDEAEYFAFIIEKTWIDSIHALAENSVCQTYYNFPAQEFGQFVHELVQGAARLRLRQSVEEAIRKASRYRNVSRDKLVWKQVSLAANIINAYIDWLGFNPRLLPQEQRQVEIEGKSFKLFADTPEIKGFPQLSEDQTQFDRSFYRDWLAAFLDLARSNVDFNGADFNIAENTRLGGLLKIMDPKP